MIARRIPTSRARANLRPAALACAVLCLALLPACSSEPSPDSPAATAAPAADFPEAGPEFAWRQWGGPRGDFHVAAGDLAPSWPAGGPPVLWHRPLGKGYSGIAYDRGVLFTLYRSGDQEVAIALRAGDGATLWEHRSPVRFHEENMLEYGEGPNATPLVLEDRVLTLGYGGILRALDRRTGRLLWSVDLISDLGGQVLHCGNSASPIPYGGRVIVLVGGARGAVAALDPADGSVAWRSPPGTVSYSTPIVIDVDGQDQLVYMSEDRILGLDAKSGAHLWSHPSFNSNRDNISPPIWGEDGLLWSSTQPDGGTRVLALERFEDRTEPRLVWSSDRIHIHFWNALRLGDHVYASIGGQGTVLVCVDVRTGEIVWRRRGFEKANFVQAGERTILLDANGRLALVELSPEGMNVVSRATVSDGPTWTVPTVAGTILYVRDQQSIRALDLGGRA